MKFPDVFIDILGWSWILLWLGLSTFFFWVGNGDSFQAVGVVGISGAVAYYAAQRHATPKPIGMIESQLLLNRRLNQISDAVGVASANIALLAKSVRKSTLEQGQEVDSIVESLSGVRHEVIEKSLEGTAREFDPLFEGNALEQRLTELMVQKARRNSELLQAIVVVLGTLQSGLGGSFVNLIARGTI